MLPFKNRLTKKRDIEKVQKIGRFVSLDNIALKFIANDVPETRVGIIVGLKYSKKAVERNKVKRVIRESIQSELKNLIKGQDLVIMPRKREEEKTKNINFKKNIREALIRGQLISSK